MPETSDTIFALSSGSLPSGVAVIRLSGNQAVSALNAISGETTEPRIATLRKLCHPQTGEVIDEALVLLFPAPNSFTGEDVVELHCHGGMATVASILETLSSLPGLRVAEPGEFSRRAFENGKLDLTQLEGLSDIIAAQTEEQRRLAVQQYGGSLRDLYDDWRKQLIRARSLIEAELDFADEDDIPGSVSDQVWGLIGQLKEEIDSHLDDRHQGEIVRRGYRVALLGKPNAGKSSLLNALAKREVAIVTPQAGTTRDVIEVSLNIGGHLLTVFDTAGIRESDDVVESEGIKRAFHVAEQADLTLWLHAADDDSEPKPPESALVVTSKDDLLTGQHPVLSAPSINTTTQNGINKLVELLEDRVRSHICDSEEPIITRQRHRDATESCSTCLERAQQAEEIEICSEYLRQAADHLGRVTGRIDVEDLLDVIFSEFCVGK